MASSTQHRRYMTMFGCVLAILAVPIIGVAHPGHHAAPPGFIEGLAHPFTGLDHLLAMVAMGLWCRQLDAPTSWIAGAAFVGAVGLGALTAPASFAGFWQQMASTASVIILGGLVGAALTISSRLALPLAAVLAYGHGALHAGAVAGAAGSIYVAGLVTSTATGLATGYLLATAANRWLDQPIVRATGGTIAAVGTGLIAVALFGP